MKYSPEGKGRKVTADAIAHCSLACGLMEGIEAENLLADKGYDSDVFVNRLKKNKIASVIPSRKCRKNPRKYDKYLYRLRRPLENGFLELEPWRGIVTRYAKNKSSFLAAHIWGIAI